MDSFSFSIKTPQLIGIIVGCIVFWITIAVVIYLLYASGALSNVFSINKTESTSIDKKQNFPFFEFPRLYDDLLQAASSLPTKPNSISLKVRKFYIIYILFDQSVMIICIYRES